MDPSHRQDASIGEAEPLDLATAYAELHNLILDGPDVVAFLHELALLAAAIVPGTHCGITLRRADQIASVAGNDEVAMRMDEIQYRQGHGPCLEALNTSRRVDVLDAIIENRWGDYSDHAVANGIYSVVALPMTIGGDTIGVLNLFGKKAHAFTEADVAHAQAFADQAATALTILLRQAGQIALDEQLREALTARAVIDQALGIIMHAQKISSSEALGIIRHASQTSNRKVRLIAEDVIETMTGHKPESPRPLTDRS